MYNIDDIPIGAKNAITRFELKNLWNLSDRDMRNEIAAMRVEDDGAELAIISSSGKVGYYRSDDECEIMCMILENAARIKSLEKVNAVTNRKLERIRKRKEAAG